MSRHHLYYPSRRQSLPSFALVAAALRYMKGQKILEAVSDAI